MVGQYSGSYDDDDDDDDDADVLAASFLQPGNVEARQELNFGKKVE